MSAVSAEEAWEMEQAAYLMRLGDPMMIGAVEMEETLEHVGRPNVLRAARISMK